MLVETTSTLNTYTFHRLVPIATEVTTVASISGDITTVAGQISPTNNISTVAGISSDIQTLADIEDGTVATNAISNVGNNIGSVTTTASNIASVNNFANVYRISSSAPTTSLDLGDLYFDTTVNELKVYGASGWQAAGSSVNGTSQRYNYTATSGQTTFTGSDNNGNTLAYDAGYIDVYLNGVKLLNGTDVTVTSGSSVVLASGATTGDVVDIVAYGTFSVASLNADNLDSGTVPNARITGAYTGITNLTMSGDLTVDTDTLYVDSTNNRVGIGTSSPDQKLHISNSASGSVSSILTIENPNGGSGTGVELRFVPSSYNNNIGSTARWSAIRAINGGSGNPTELTFLTNSASADPSERMRIDSSGRLIVNDTSAIFSNSKIQAVNSSGPTLGIKQTTGTQSAGGFWNSSTDASVKVISVYKGTSGNEVGTIGVTNNDNLYIQGDATDSGLQCGTNTILPVQNGVNADNTIDLGASTIRWKDLYLGGGLYVGGTAAANKLDDYEEGTWTPTCVGSTTAGTVTMSSTYTRGRYTKIGNTVYIHCVVVWSSLTGTGNLEITGIPFTSRNIGSANSVNSSFVNFNGLTVPANQIPFARIPNNSDKITTATIPTGGGGTSLLAVDTAGELYFNITYTTDA